MMLAALAPRIPNKRRRPVARKARIPKLSLIPGRTLLDDAIFERRRRSRALVAAPYDKHLLRAPNITYLRRR